MNLNALGFRYSAWSGTLEDSNGVAATTRNRIDWMQSGSIVLTTYTNSVGGYSVDNLADGAYTMQINGVSGANGVGTDVSETPNNTTIQVGPTMSPTQNITSPSTDVRQVFGFVHYSLANGSGFATKANLVQFKTGGAGGTLIGSVYTALNGFYILTLPVEDHCTVLVDGDEYGMVTNSGGTNLNPVTITGNLEQRLDIYASACDSQTYGSPPAPDTAC